jgi:hypothetical protein
MATPDSSSHLAAGESCAPETHLAGGAGISEEQRAPQTPRTALEPSVVESTWTSRWAGGCLKCGLSTAGGSLAGEEAAALLAIVGRAWGSEALGGKIACEECGGEAALLCSRCEAALCMPCHAKTHASRLFQAHPVERIEGHPGSREPARRAPPPPRCALHPRQALSYLAADGCTLLCRDCLIGLERGAIAEESPKPAVPVTQQAAAVRAELGALAALCALRAKEAREAKAFLTDELRLVDESHGAAVHAGRREAGALQETIVARMRALEAEAAFKREEGLRATREAGAVLQSMRRALGHARAVGAAVAERATALEALQLLADLEPRIQRLATSPLPPAPSAGPPLLLPAVFSGVREARGGKAPSEKGALEAVVGSEDDSDSLAAVSRGHVLQHPRSRFETPTLTKAVFAVGGSDGVVDHGDMEILVPEGRGAVWGNWHSAVLPQATQIRAAGCVALGGRVYVVGGWDGHSALHRCHEWTPGSAGADPGKGKWRELGAMTSARQALGCAAMGGMVYAVGGFDGKSNLATVERMDPAAGVWQRVAPMRAARRGAAAVALGPLLLAIGGSDAQAVHASVEVYDPYADAWAVHSTLQVPRRLASAAQVGGMVVVAGGWDGAHSLASAERLDPSGPSGPRWELLPRMAEPRQGCGAAALGATELLVFGGWDGHAATRARTTEVLDLVAGQWRAGPPLSLPRYALAAAAVVGYLD